MQMMEGKDRRPRGIDLLQGSPRSPAARLPLDPAPFCGLPRPTGMNGGEAPSHFTGLLARAGTLPHHQTYKNKSIMLDNKNQYKCTTGYKRKLIVKLFKGRLLFHIKKDKSIALDNRIYYSFEPIRY